jgi:hypothetical protein
MKRGSSSSPGCLLSVPYSPWQGAGLYARVFPHVSAGVRRPRRSRVFRCWTPVVADRARAPYSKCAEKAAQSPGSMALWRLAREPDASGDRGRGRVAARPVPALAQAAKRRDSGSRTQTRQKASVGEPRRRRSVAAWRPWRASPADVCPRCAWDGALGRETMWTRMLCKASRFVWSASAADTVGVRVAGGDAAMTWT